VEDHERPESADAKGTVRNSLKKKEEKEEQ
jgi:hypothetical protein